MKVLPQWLLNAAFELKIDLSLFNLLGVIFSLVGSVSYAMSASMSHTLVLTRKGFEWRSRDEAKEKLLGVGCDSSSQMEPETEGA